MLWGATFEGSHRRLIDRVTICRGMGSEKVVGALRLRVIKLTDARIHSHRIAVIVLVANKMRLVQ